MEKLSSKRMNKLVSGIATGDRRALKELYTTAKTPLFLYVKSVVKSHEISEDITQQVFVEIMECAHKFKRDTNAKAWVFTIARNLCMDYFKKNNREVSTDDTESIFEFKTETIKDNMFVYEALSRLDSIECQIVTLYVFGGFKQKEIAAILQLPYVSVRSKYGYAMQKLKRIYKGELI